MVNTTVDRMMDVLLLFDDDHQERSAAEIARALDMARSTTYRYLGNLRAVGLLEEDTLPGRYRLGPKILELARVARRSWQLPDIALPTMRELERDLGETVLLTRLSGNAVVCMERIETSHPIRISYDVGQVLPIHAGSAAKVLLAFTDDALVAQFLEEVSLERFTGRTITEPERLREECRLIREQGYAVSTGEIDDGVRGIAAPILGRQGVAIAGLSVAGPATRLSDERLPELIGQVRDAADEIADRAITLGL